MDINVNIKKDLEEKKPKGKTIFTLDCIVKDVSTKDEELYNIKGHVKADKMDPDLMSDILSTIIKQSVPEVAIEEVLNLTADKLGFTEEKCDKECCKTKDTDKFIELLHRLLGE